MTAQTLVALLEEMVDIKVQQHVELQARLTPELNRLVREKRESVRQRLEQIRSELVNGLTQD